MDRDSETKSKPAKPSSGGTDEVTVDIGVDDGSKATRATVRLPPRRETAPRDTPPESRPEPQAVNPEPAPESPKPAPKPAEPERKAPTGPKRPFTEGMSENVAAPLTYLFGWVSGVVFLMVDRRPYVRYHAAQSTIVFAALSLALLFLGDFFLAKFLGDSAGTALLVLRRAVELVWLASAVFLMIKAASGERTHVPFASKFADNAARGGRSTKGSDDTNGTPRRHEFSH